MKGSGNLFIIVTADTAAVFLSFSLAHLIRFDFMIPQLAWEKYIEIIPYVLIIKILCFYSLGLYKRIWEYTSLNDLMNAVKTVTVSTLCLIVLILYVNRFKDISRSIFIIDWCLTIISILYLRIFTRLYFKRFNHKEGDKNFFKSLFKRIQDRKQRAIIIGARNYGKKICREILNNPLIKYHVNGFLEDDPSVTGKKIRGIIPVLGKIDQIEYFIKSTGADEVIIAISLGNEKQIKHIVNVCININIGFKIIPSVEELINRKISLNFIRNKKTAR